MCCNVIPPCPAGAPSDYGGIDVNVTVPEESINGSFHTIRVMIVDDAIVEDTESFRVSVSAVDSDAEFEQGSDEAIVTILDNDGKVFPIYLRLCDAIDTTMRT